MKYKKYLILLIILLSSINYINPSSADWTAPSNSAEVLQALADVDAYRDSQWNTVTTWGSAANLIVNLENNTVTVTCDNWASSTEISLPPAEIAALSTTATALGYDEVVITPPVLTTASSTSGSCSSYISWWRTTWSSCFIEWAWNSNWNINCKQTPSFTAKRSWCWSKVCTTSYTDWVATGTSCWPCTWCPSNRPRPRTWPAIKVISLNINNPWSTCNWLMANNSDICDIKITVSWNTNQNKPVVWWWIQWNLNNITDTSNQWSDRINWWWTALNFNTISNTWPINGKWDYYIDWIKSRSPFSDSNWNIWITVWNTYLSISNILYSFSKPLIWRLYSSWDNWTTWDGLPSLWTLSKYKLSYANIWNALLTNYSIENFVSKIKPTSVDFEIQDGLVNSSTLNTNWTLFSARINTSSEEITSLSTPWLKIESPIISYNLWWEAVKYILSKNNWAIDTAPIDLMWEDFLWVKVIWSLQWDWKQAITWQESNFSDLSLFSMRTDIRKNAYSFIKNLPSWSIVSWVKYVNWEDIIISWDQNFETLVVKDGNVIINWNLNNSGKKLWIIVLKDWYNMNWNFSDSWNVYINSNVTYINALIYADWWVISSYNWTAFLNDSTSRTYELNNQLIIKWTLFTRNTIWWAILSGWYYLLPWNIKTSDFDLAMVFDFNYLRRWNNWCDKNDNLSCDDNWEDKEPTILIYDSKLSTNAPKLFVK